MLAFVVPLALATFPTSSAALAASEPDKSSQAAAEASGIPDAISRWIPKGSQSFVVGETLPDLAAEATYPCQGAKRYQWQGSDGVGVRLTWVDCRAKGDAWQFERLFWKSQNHGIVSDASVFDGADTVQVKSQTADVTRGWPQGTGYFFLNVVCKTSLEECLVTNGVLSQDLSRVLPDVPGTFTYQVDGSKMAGIILSAPLAAWLLLYAPWRVIAFSRRSRNRSVEGPYPYKDVRSMVFRARVTSSIRATLLVASGVALLAGYGSMTLNLSGAWMWFGAGICGLLIRRRIPRNTLRPLKSYFDTTSRRGLAGLLVMSAGRLMSTLVVFVYLTVVIIGWASTSMSEEMLAEVVARQQASPFLWDEARSVFLAFSIVISENRLGELLGTILVIPALAFCYLIDRLGLRIGAYSVDRFLARDNRPHLLYLRSFDEDRLKIVAGLTRRGIVHRLSPLRRVNFEEILVRCLSRFGPVIAISPPGQVLPKLGAAKVSLSNETWQSQVQHWTNNALAVVMSATPSDVRPGLAWEIDHVAQTIPNRLMLVRAPWPTKKLVLRWQAFMQYGKRWDLFRSIPGGCVQEGAQLLVHSEKGWESFGARTASDWTYAASITSAMRSVALLWEAELVRAGDSTNDPR